MVRLRRVDCAGPGLTRRRRGRGFSYHEADGTRVTDPEILARIEALVIPPAWSEVWICPLPHGHIQAVGTDAAGRRQYRYHDVWRVQRDRAKHDRVLEFAEALPDVRAQVAEHLALRGLPREKALAAAVRLLDLGFFRIGSESYAEENGTFGLATLRRDHVTISRGVITFDYTAKSGKRRVQSVADETLLAVVTTLRRRRGGGDELLAYRNGRGWQDVKSDEINAYLRELTGLEASAKDFRTWHATVLMAVALAVSEHAPTSASARKRAVSRAVQEVAHYLGNTPAVCRSSYIDPRVVDLYDQDITIADRLVELGEGGRFGQPATQGEIEGAVLRLLRDPPQARARARKAG